MPNTSLYSYTKQELVALFATRFGEDKSVFRARAVFRALYKNEGELFGEQSLLSVNVQRFLRENYELENQVFVEEAHVSSQDSSVKFVLKLRADNARIEGILIPERGRLTLCVSSQVGCLRGCRFCQTGRMGLLRNLDSNEIVGQVLAVQQWIRENKPKFAENDNQSQITNIVFMGMGEPLDNLNSVLKSTSIFCDGQAFNLSHHKVTVSTVGVLDKIQEFLRQSPVSLAFSLHSPFDVERTRMIPTNTTNPLEKLIDTLKNALNNGLRKSFLIQYTLIRGVNDSVEHAMALSRLLAGYSFKVNLIPLNEHTGAAFRRPDLCSVYDFQQTLKQNGLVATIRLSKGRDVSGACGQLIQNNKDNKIENKATCA